MTEEPLSDRTGSEDSTPTATPLRQMTTTTKDRNRLPSTSGDIYSRIPDPQEHINDLYQYLGILWVFQTFG